MAGFDIDLIQVARSQGQISLAHRLGPLFAPAGRRGHWTGRESGEGPTSSETPLRILAHNVQLPSRVVSIPARSSDLCGCQCKSLTRQRSVI